MKLHRSLILPPLLVGVVGLVLMTRARREPERTDLAERAVPVQVQTVAPRTVVPRAIGYGTVEPSRTWRARAEVGGRVAWTSPLLAAGEIVAEGTELLRIDDTDVRLTIARLQAEIRSSEAELEKLSVTRANLEASLEVRRRTLALAERELERLRALAEDGTVSQSSQDAQEQATLLEQAAVVELENALRVTPADEAVLEAALGAARVRLQEAERDLARTVITAPYRCRVAAVDVEEARYVTPGAPLFEADGIDVAEVRAELPTSRVRSLVHRSTRETLLAAMERGELWRTLGLSCVVRLTEVGVEAEWPARFARAAGGLDPRTRTASLVAAVDDPYDVAGSGDRQPLIKGMFVEVEFEGPPLEGRIAIPLTALHEDRVYLVDGEGRLEIRPVELEFVQLDEAILAGGLSGGERLVLTDLVPALPGMLLEPVATRP